MRASIGLYSVDPLGVDSFSCFDPESYFVINAVNEALIAVGLEGEIVPSLALSWEQKDPLTLEFELRRGVVFHDGEPFDARSVVATFEHHRSPTPTPTAGILKTIARVEALGTHRIRVVTHHPDAMLLRKLYFLVIYPAGALERGGIGPMASHPVGTGPYRFVHWKRGEEILIRRFEHHWAGFPGSGEVSLPIVRQTEWVDRLERGELDLILNLEAHDAIRAGRVEGVEVGHADASLSQWFLFANRGPLADVRVRRALNHAVKRSLIAEVSQHGMASPQRGVATAECLGWADPPPYRYSPELAREMLAEAGHADGFVLRGLVSESSTGVYFAVREFLQRVGVELTAEIVPRAEWIHRVAGANHHGAPYDADFALALIDNPLLDGLFHHYLFFFSHGPMGMFRDPTYDGWFLKAATTVGEGGEEARQDLDRYAVDRALLLLTQQQQMHAAWRPGCEVRLPRSGHFTTAFWWELDLSPRTHDGPRGVQSTSPDVEALLSATSHTGTFFLPDGQPFEEDWARLLWMRLQTSEARWRVTHEPMIRELVTQIESRNDLASILGSTERVAIVGYTLEGRLRFRNAGYRTMLCDHPGHVRELLRQPAWDTITEAVQAEGAWLGPVELDPERLPDLPATHLYLTAAPAQDDEGVLSGITLVFSDFSGEEERIRNQAIRVVLDNVPYGLFVVDAAGRLRSGYSEACRDLFPGFDELEGRDLVELLALPEREAGNLLMAMDQVFFDLLPEEVGLGQIPSRVPSRGRHLSLEAAVIRDEAGQMDGLLFTCADISALIAAEADAVAMHGAVSVLRFRERFQGFVWDLLDTLADLERSHGDEGWEVLARRELHTAKGVFGQFELVGLQRLVHDLEEVPTIRRETLAELRDGILATLAEHRDLWGIADQRQSGCYEVSSDRVDRYERLAEQARGEDELREVVRALLEEVRSRPADTLLGPVAKQVEQLAERQGKDVQVLIDGGEERVPAQLFPVFDLLGHLVRNAVDHGVEVPALRGDKPARATVRLGVQRVASHVRITIQDDGAGIPAERLLARAVERGVITEEAGVGLARSEVLQLIFADGLSTADSVTTTSGRGVGMAAVREAVQRHGGRIDIWTQPGEGTRFELSFELTGSEVAQGAQGPAEPV